MTVEICRATSNHAKQDSQEQTVSFASLVLIAQQWKYCTTQKELLAVVRFCIEFRNYLLGHPFLVRTDHNSLAC